MNNKKMYVWRIADNKHGCYTEASAEMRPIDVARYNKIDKDDNIELHSFINFLSKTYLTKHRGDIAFSEHPTYEDAIESLRGSELHYECHTEPTKH